MATVLWQTSAFRTPKASAASRIPGAYAGRARFSPCDVSRLPDVLGLAAGSIVELAFAGIAGPGEPFCGQCLYLEWRTDTLLHGFLMGKSPASRDDLVKAGLLRKDELAHAGGAAITWEPGKAARSARGTPAAMTPLIDLPEPATVTEA